MRKENVSALIEDLCFQDFLWYIDVKTEIKLLADIESLSLFQFFALR